MSRLLILILLLSSCNLRAEIFKCVAFGVNVPQIATTAEVIAAQHVETGVATIRDGKLVTLYDRRLFFKPEEFRNHVLAHECAHHQLGHTLYPTAYRGKEAQADCLSIVLLQEQLNYTQKEFTIIFSAINNPYRKVRMQSCNNGERR